MSDKKLTRQEVVDSIKSPKISVEINFFERLDEWANTREEDEYIDLSKERFENINIESLEAKYLNLTNAHFDQSNIVSIGIKLSRLDGAYFNKALLYRSEISNSTLRLSDFSESDVRDCEFDNSNLGQSDFKKSNLKITSFKNSNLSGADFSGAILEYVGFAGTDLTNCNWGEGEDCVKIRSAEISSKTKGLETIPEHVLPYLLCSAAEGKKLKERGIFEDDLVDAMVARYERELVRFDLETYTFPDLVKEDDEYRPYILDNRQASNLAIATQGIFDIRDEMVQTGNVDYKSFKAKFWECKRLLSEERDSVSNELENSGIEPISIGVNHEGPKLEKSIFSLFFPEAAKELRRKAKELRNERENENRL